MTKIRCQICGGENLHAENGTLVVCDDCGNRTYLIPEKSILRVDEEEDCDLVSVHFDKSKTECPRQSFCLNDTMDPGGQPCKVCNLVKKRFSELTSDLVSKFDERQDFIQAHPELEDDVRDEMELVDQLNRAVNSSKE